MSKANRTCYCCGREYYYCPSCTGENKDPRVYTMWDSELCKDIFDALVSESTKKVNTKECKDKLIQLGVNKSTILKESVRKHVDRVMAYKEPEQVKFKPIVEIKQIEEDEKIVEPVVIQDAIVVSDEEKEIVVDEKESIETKSTIEFESSILTEEVKSDSIKKENNKRARKSSIKNKENSEVD